MTDQYFYNIGRIRVLLPDNIKYTAKQPDINNITKYHVFDGIIICNIFLGYLLNFQNKNIRVVQCEIQIWLDHIKIWLRTYSTFTWLCNQYLAHRKRRQNVMLFRQYFISFDFNEVMNFTSCGSRCYYDLTKVSTLRQKS